MDPVGELRDLLLGQALAVGAGLDLEVRPGPGGSVGRQDQEEHHGRPEQRDPAERARKPDGDVRPPVDPLEEVVRVATVTPQALTTRLAPVLRSASETGQLAIRSGFAGDGVEILTQGRFRHLAIANPKTAPYGVAARQALESLGLWETIEPRLVRGENIGQTFQYVASGAAELGLVSRSQLPALNAGAGYDWPVPSHLHTPIRQQAVLLARGAGNPAATDFLIFLRSDIAAALIAEAGYLVGDGGDR